MSPAPTAPTPAQRRVLSTAGIRRVGTDARNRPIVEGKVGIPNQLRTWAVKRDGDPTDPAEPVTLEVEHALDEPESPRTIYGRDTGWAIGCSCGWRAGTMGDKARILERAEAHLQAVGARA